MSASSGSQDAAQRVGRRLAAPPLDHRAAHAPRERLGRAVAAQVDAAAHAPRRPGARDLDAAPPPAAPARCAGSGSAPPAREASGASAADAPRERVERLLEALELLALDAASRRGW